MLKKYSRVILSLLIFMTVSFPIFKIETAQANYSVDDCIKDPSKCEKPLTDETVKKDQTFEGITLFDYVKMIFALLFVLALLFIILKVIQKKGQSLDNRKVIKHLGGTNLGTNKSIQVIKVGDEVLVLGVGDNVTLLKEIEDTQKIENLFYEDQQRLIEQSPVNKIKEYVEKKELKSFEEQFKEILAKRKSTIQDVTEEGSKRNE